MLFGKHINRYYLRYGPLLLLGAAALVAVDYFQLVVPELYRMVINGVNDGIVAVDGAPVPFTMDFLLDRICLPLLGVIAVMVAGRFLWRVCFFGSAIRVESDLRRRMFDRCKDLSQQYYQVNKVGGLMSLFTNDLETVQECFGSGVLMLCDALLLGVLAIVKMFRMDWKLTLFSLAPMVLLFFVGSTVGRYMTRKWDERQAAFSSLSDFSQETFSGIAVVKAFVKEFTELMAFRRLNRDNERTNVNYARASTLLHILVTLFVESVVCVILGYGGYLVYTGVFNAGQMVEFIGYFTAIVWPVMAVAELIEMHARGKASLSRIGALLDARPDVADAPGLPAGPQKPAAGGIAFRGLSFTYPGAAVETLHDVSFEILPGETVGVIGRTGSGKTTLADLILRVYNVPRGTLFLDGRDVNDVPIRALRDSVAYVPQDGFLFSDTIGRNIAFSVDGEDPAAVERAARMAGVHDDVAAFPDGYATVLGERGVTVSGGQKQRIAIARALIKDAPILILDDSVSAVDVSTEETILAHLRAERAGRTTILIAHRVSTIENADKIVFLDDGRVAAVGDHATLCRTCPAYAELVELQRLDDEGRERA